MHRHAGSGSVGGLRGRLAAAAVGVRCLLGHHCGDRVFEDKLFLVISFQDQGVLIETLDAAGQLELS